MKTTMPQVNSTLLSQWLKLSEDNKSDIVSTYKTIKSHVEFSTVLEKAIYEDSNVDADKFPVQKFCGIWDNIVKTIQADVRHNEAFFTILQLIGGYVEEKQMNLQTYDLLEARKQLLFTLERSLGCDFDADVRDAWVKLSCFVLLCYVSNQHSEDVAIPEKEQYELCMQTLEVLDRKSDYYEGKIAEKVEAQAPEAYKILYKDPNIKVAGLLSRIIGTAGYHKAFYATLIKLGAMHQTMGVYPEYLEQIKMPFVEVVIEAMGRDWNNDYLNAWVTVYGYLQTVMGNALREKFLLNSIPESYTRVNQPATGKDVQMADQSGPRRSRRLRKEA